MSENKELAKRYLAAVHGQGYDDLKEILRSDFWLKSPNESFTSADAFVAKLKEHTWMKVTADIKRIFEDDGDVCVIYDWTMDPIGTTTFVEWLTIESGQIVSCQVYHDTGPFTEMAKKMEK